MYDLIARIGKPLSVALLTTVFVISGCTSNYNGEKGNMSKEMDHDKQHDMDHDMKADMHGKMKKHLMMALADSSRSAADRTRDMGRKPAMVVDFLGVKPGMTVVDLIAASGYYTEVMSLAVGDSGKVYAQNPDRILKMRDGANEKALSERLDGRLANVERLDMPIDEMQISANSVDIAFTALNFHDIYNGSSPEAALGTSKLVFAMLKPGGIFGVIDHRGMPGMDNKSMHRIDVALVRETLEKAGFEVEESNMLMNPDDAHDKMVFDASIRGKTDRFLIRARKPN